jgi:hypothetical protein
VAGSKVVALGALVSAWRQSSGGDRVAALGWLGDASWAVVALGWPDDGGWATTVGWQWLGARRGGTGWLAEE